MSMSEAQAHYDLVQAAAEELRQTLQGIHVTHALYADLTKELELLDHYLAEHKEDSKK